MKKTLKILFCFFLMIFAAAVVKGQNNTIGLIMYDSSASFNGYTLFSPLSSTNTYLIDNEGYLVHSWSSSYKPGQAVMLLPDGSLLRTAAIVNGNPFNAGGSAGRVEKYDWDGNLTWSFNYYSSEYSTHHDVEYLPDGNILLIAWEKKSYDEAISAGRNPSTLGNDIWSEKVIEVKPTGSSGGEIVWEWHVWDHLIQDYDSTKSNYGIVTNHPELIDLNFSNTNNEDWLHINSIRYNPERDEILLSVHNFNEIWVIDHSTTTAQAAGHSGGNKGKGGDLIYRWGNPQAYRAGNATDQKLFGQHDARWIAPGLPGEGDILIFNNGQGRPDGNYSSVDQITPPIDSSGHYYMEASGIYRPDSVSWSYEAQPADSFFAQNISGATRLSNGNTLICVGPSGKFFEITDSGKTVWEYINPVSKNGILTQGEEPVMNPVFKIYRYSPQYSGLAGKDLSREGRIENYTTNVNDENLSPSGFSLQQNYPNPFNPMTIISFSLPQSQNVSLKVYDLLGHEVKSLINGFQKAGNHEINFNGENLPSGIYFYKLQTESFFGTKKMTLLK